jgi:predicted ATPase
VEGEPGIGKSLLLRDSTGEAAEQGFSLAVGTADQLGEVIPFSALHWAFRDAFAEPHANDLISHRPSLTSAQRRGMQP